MHGLLYLYTVFDLNNVTDNVYIQIEAWTAKAVPVLSTFLQCMHKQVEDHLHCLKMVVVTAIWVIILAQIGTFAT